MLLEVENRELSQFYLVPQLNQSCYNKAESLLYIKKCEQHFTKTGQNILICLFVRRGGIDLVKHDSRIYVTSLSYLKPAIIYLCLRI